MTEIKEKEKIDNYLEGASDNPDREKLRSFAAQAVVALVGFCLGQAELFSVMSPFAHAFVGTVPFRFYPGAFFGCVIGYLVDFSGSFTVRNVLSLMFICLVRFITDKKFSDYAGSKAESLLVLFSVVVSSVAGQIFTAFSFSAVIASLTEGVVAFCTSCLFSRSFRVPVVRMGLAKLATIDKISIGISFCIFMFCFSSINVEGFSPARLAGCLILCTASYCKGISAGSILGSCLGAGLYFSTEGGFIFPAYALGGLVSGVFSHLGQVATGISACLSFCFVCIVSGGGENFLLPIIECGVACATFMIIPSAQLTNFAEIIKQSGVVGDDDVNLQVSALLKKASCNIYSFCKTVSNVSTRLDRVINPEVNKLFFEVQQNVCDGCSKKSICWNVNFNLTAGDILAITGIEKRGNGKLQIEKDCMRLHELKKQLARSKSQYSLNMLTKTKNREMRCLLTEQFSGMGDFLSELADKIAKSRAVDTVKSTALRAAVIDKGIYIDTLSCFGGNEGRIGIEIICLEKHFETDYRKIKTILENGTSRVFEDPEISVTDVGTLIKFEEKSPFMLLVGSAQRPFVKDSPCGDSLAFCKRNDVSGSVLLSDGMGTGSSAALDSMLAVSLTEKLLSAGFSFESSVKIVNSSLIMKSTDESMATMDGLNVNLYTGEAEFYKAGAAISLIRSDREIFVIEESSLPLGILREVKYSKTAFSLKHGDIVLMVSDGITAEDCGWINDELLSWSTNNMDDLACHIVELAALRQDRFTGDDLTAVAVKLVKNR